MRTHGQAGAARIEDRRTPPRAAYLAVMQKLILNDPSKPRELPDAAPTSQRPGGDPIYFRKATGKMPDPVATRKRISRKYTQALAGYNTGERRSGR